MLYASRKTLYAKIMTLKNRRKIFYSLIVIFGILGAGLVSYSMGWRFDFETFQFKKSGGLLVRLASSDAVIKIGREVFNANSALLYQGTLITNLFPKTYKIEVAEKNYQSWSKNLTIEPSLVTKTNPVILMPEKPLRELLSKEIKDFWLGPKYLAQKTTFGQFLINGRPARGNKIIEWSKNGDWALVLDQKQQTYFLIDISKENTALNLSMVLENLTLDRISKVGFDPADNNKLILTTAGGLYDLNVNALSLQRIKPPPLSQATGGKISPDNQKLAIFNAKTDAIDIRFLADAEALNKKQGDFVALNTDFPEPLSDFYWHNSSAYLFAQYASNLYFVEIDDRPPLNWQSIANDVDKFQYNPQNDTLYVLSGRSLYKLDLK